MNIPPQISSARRMSICVDRLDELVPSLPRYCPLHIIYQFMYKIGAGPLRIVRGVVERSTSILPAKSMALTSVLTGRVIFVCRGNSKVMHWMLMSLVALFLDGVRAWPDHWDKMVKNVVLANATLMVIIDVPDHCPNDNIIYAMSQADSSGFKVCNVTEKEIAAKIRPGSRAIYELDLGYRVFPDE